MSNVLFDSTDDEALRRQRLYAGDIYVYSPTPASKRLVELARQMCETAFRPHAPPLAQYHLPVETYISVLKELKPKFIHHPECKQHIPEALTQLGCDRSQTYFDVPRLRTACAGDYLSTGMAYAFKPHRDTWYSPPMCQINWWLPVYPIQSTNAMAFHPSHWERPVKNNSALFDYQDWNIHGRVQAANQSAQKDTRFQSAALEDINLLPDLRLVCPPGGMIVFAAAHLHSTVPNSSDETRISIDFRTVDARDVAANRGAPNIDSQARGTTLMDYLRVADLAHFSESDIVRETNRPRDPIFPTPPELVEQSI